MVSTTEGFTYNIPISPSQSVTLKKPSAIKSLRHFLYTLEVKPKNSVQRFCAAKSKRKSIIADSILWSNIPKKQANKKINQQVKNLLTIGFYNILRLWCLQ